MSFLLTTSSFIIVGIFSHSAYVFGYDLYETAVEENMRTDLITNIRWVRRWHNYFDEPLDMHPVQLDFNADFAARVFQERLEMNFVNRFLHENPSCIPIAAVVSIILFATCVRFVSIFISGESPFLSGNYSQVGFSSPEEKFNYSLEMIYWKTTNITESFMHSKLSEQLHHPYFFNFFEYSRWHSFVLSKIEFIFNTSMPLCLSLIIVVLLTCGFISYLNRECVDFLKQYKKETILIIDLLLVSFCITLIGITFGIIVETVITLILIL